jgi:hypothetical protein
MRVGVALWRMWLVGVADVARLWLICGWCLLPPLQPRHPRQARRGLTTPVVSERISNSSSGLNIFC